MKPDRPPTLARGTLYVVGTPLGHLEDLTLRAIRVLRDVDLIACEDTRRTARLLAAHGIRTPTTSFFEHNERAKGRRILAALGTGRSVALVADAGTPAISDPGFTLVRDARAQGLPVVPVPGPSAVAAALSVSGLPSDRFLFVGFLPSRAAPRRRALAGLAAEEATLVFYESPVRVVSSLAAMAEILGDRDAFLFREATKLHEEYRRGHLSELRASLASRGEVRGEITLVVAGAAQAQAQGRTAPAAEAEAAFARLVAEGLTRREAVKELARRLGLPAREVYRRVEKTPLPSRS